MAKDVKIRYKGQVLGIDELIREVNETYRGVLELHNEAALRERERTDLSTMREEIKRLSLELEETYRGILELASELDMAHNSLLKSEKNIELVSAATKLVLWEWNINDNVFKFITVMPGSLGYYLNESCEGVDSFLGMIHPDDFLWFAAKWESFLSGKDQVIRCECRMRAEHGGWLWVLYSARATELDAEGRLQRAVGTVLDIEEQKKAAESVRKINRALEERVSKRTVELEESTRHLQEEIIRRQDVERALQKARIQAEKASREKSDFLARMSHELRTPLHAISGYAELLSKDRSLSGEQERRIGIINRSGTHLLGLINDILDLSKIEAGYISLENSAFCVREMADDVEQMLKGRAVEKNIGLMFSVVSDVPSQVVTDQAKLRQILINLIGNAIKFTDHGGVVVRLFMVGGHDGQSEDRHEDQRLQCMVTDSGCGIDKNERESIFEPFSQGMKKRNKAVKVGDIYSKGYEGGSGLGLAICRRYANFMGGEITYSANPSGGSIFTVDIPVEYLTQGDMQNERDSDDKEETLSGVLDDQRNVFVVDDEEINCLLLEEMLEPAGFQVRTAFDATSALAMLDTYRPDIILMDYSLPDMTGAQVTSIIKKKMDVPVIIVSGHTYEACRDDEMIACVDDWLVKPFKKKELLEKMAMYLKKVEEQEGV